MTPATAASTPAPAQTGSREVDPARVAEWLKAGECTLIDVREADEFARERVAEAKLLPLSRFDPAAIEGQRAEAATNRVVLMCKSGRRSGDALRHCLANRTATGHLEVLVMSGGIEAWKARGLPTVPVSTRGGSRSIGLGVLQQTQVAIGLLTLTGMAIGTFLHPVGYLLPVITGCGLIMAGTTGLCPLATLIGSTPWNRTAREAARTDSCCAPDSQPPRS